MQTILIISGQESSEFAKGDYNRGLAATMIEELSENYSILTTNIEAGYKPQEEIEKFKQADIVIYQYPVYWFTMPSTMKRYIDEVYAYGDFFGHSEGPYGTGGLMSGKKFMLSTTWNAPANAFNNGTAFFRGLSVEDALLPMRATHEFCGFDELPHFAAHDVIGNPQFEADNVRLKAHLTSVFQKTDAGLVA